MVHKKADSRSNLGRRRSVRATVVTYEFKRKDKMYARRRTDLWNGDLCVFFCGTKRFKSSGLAVWNVSAVENMEGL